MIRLHLLAMTILFVTAFSFLGCESKKETTGIATEANDRIAADVEDGADPSPEITRLRQKAFEYLKSIKNSKDQAEEEEAINRLVHWLQSLNKNKAIKIEDADTQQAGDQGDSDDLKIVSSGTSTIHVICFPPRYASVEYHFKDSKSKALFDPVLFVE